MALSVRLPKISDCDKPIPSQLNTKVQKSLPISSPENNDQDFVQHYLIEQHQGDVKISEGSDNPTNQCNDRSKVKKMKLESSHNTFDNILSLVYHYLTVR